MKQLRTEAIILRRTNYGEADRILNLLTPEHGKLSAMAKGVRRPKSKLAGGLELFATSDVSIVQRQGSELGLLTSARLIKFYGNILRDYDRMQLSYEFIKLVNRATETVADPEFYHLLRNSFEYLDNLKIEHVLTELWFRLHLVRALGTGLNLSTDAAGRPLAADAAYNFDFANMAFIQHPSGRFQTDHLKLLRLASVAEAPALLSRLRGQDFQALVGACVELTRAL